MRRTAGAASGIVLTLPTPYCRDLNTQGPAFMPQARSIIASRVSLQNSAWSLGRGFFRAGAQTIFNFFFNFRERLRPYLTYVK